MYKKAIIVILVLIGSSTVLGFVADKFGLLDD